MSFPPIDDEDLERYLQHLEKHYDAAGVMIIVVKPNGETVMGVKTSHSGVDWPDILSISGELVAAKALDS